MFPAERGSRTQLENFWSENIFQSHEELSYIHQVFSRRKGDLTLAVWCFTIVVTLQEENNEGYLFTFFLKQATCYYMPPTTTSSEPRVA